ncbi:MAG: hypothetical protein J6O55_03755 [Lachnospiraceae bacterium]|nr:hypothetical protein [Lachnospiraceae bacterium]
MEKLELSEAEAGKLLDVSEEELLPLRFNAYSVDAIEKGAKEVVEKYAKKHGLKKPE